MRHGRGHSLLALGKAVTRIAIERIQVFGLDEIEADIIDALQQRDDLIVAYRTARRQVAAVPLVAAEGLRRPVWKHLLATVAQDGEIQPVSSGSPEDSAEIVGGSLFPIKENIDSDQLFPGHRPFLQFEGGHWFCFRG